MKTVNVRASCDLLIFVDGDEIARTAHSFFMVALVNVGTVRDLLLAVETKFVTRKAQAICMVGPCLVRASFLLGSGLANPLDNSSRNFDNLILILLFCF